MNEPAHILVVDDTPANVKLLADLAGAKGYRVTTASSGAQALKMIAESPPDLVLLDVVMPGMSGYEVCRAIRQDPATATLPVVIDDALTLVRGRAVQHGVDLERDIDARLGEFIGDELKFKQIVLNLLSNALKFTPQGGRVRVSASLLNGHAQIAVSDTGIGIAPTDQEKIFEAFRQVNGDHARAREGTGLGLTLTRKFVELHGGRIWVDSLPAHGATFTFTLPVRAWPVN